MGARFPHDGVGTEGLPDDILANIRRHEERRPAAETVASPGGIIGAFEEFIQQQDL